MSNALAPSVPHPAHTLDVLLMMGSFRPIMMLPGANDGGGARWLIDGQPIQPAIVKFLMAYGFVAETGITEFGARKLTITGSGQRFREKGVNWWNQLGLVQQLKIRLFG